MSAPGISEKLLLPSVSFSSYDCIKNGEIEIRVPVIESKYTEAPCLEIHYQANGMAETPVGPQPHPLNPRPTDLKAPPSLLTPRTRPYVQTPSTHGSVFKLPSHKKTPASAPQHPNMSPPQAKKQKHEACVEERPPHGWSQNPLSDLESITDIGVPKDEIASTLNKELQVPIQIAPAKTVHETNVEWTTSDQSVLEHAILMVPPTPQNPSKRWETVAKAFPNKSVQDILQRVMWMQAKQVERFHNDRLACVARNRILLKDQFKVALTMDSTKLNESLSSQHRGTRQMTFDIINEPEDVARRPVPINTANTYLNENSRIIGQIRKNLSTGELNNNVVLVDSFRRNLIALLSWMESIPNVSLPPLGMALDTSLLPHVALTQSPEQEPQEPSTPQVITPIIPRPPSCRDTATIVDMASLKPSTAEVVEAESPSPLEETEGQGAVVGPPKHLLKGRRGRPKKSRGRKRVGN